MEPYTISLEGVDDVSLNDLAKDSFTQDPHFDRKVVEITRAYLPARDAGNPFTPDESRPCDTRVVPFSERRCHDDPAVSGTIGIVAVAVGCRHADPTSSSGPDQAGKVG